MKLNGWERIGIILSSCWLAWACYVSFVEIYDNPPLDYSDGSVLPPGFVLKGEEVTKPVTDPKLLKKSNSIDENEKKAELSTYSDEELAKIAGVTLKSKTGQRSWADWEWKTVMRSLPMLITWIFVYTFFALFQWVKRGFKPMRT